MKTEPTTAAVAHTPGPWKAGQYMGGAHWNISGDGQHIASVPGFIGSPVLMDRDGQGQANARLIAAAPDLLAALTATSTAMEKAKKLLRVAGLTMEGGTISDPYNDAIAQATIVIAKATGQA